MPQQGHIYFHSLCFDGIVSAVLSWKFLETRQSWREVELHTVNYDVQQSWLRSVLERPAAVVDFLYHPQADFFADHHLTTFVNDVAREDYGRRKTPNLVYDEGAGSCASLLWNHLWRAFGHRDEFYHNLVIWAEKIDSARYESVAEAIFSPGPALKINAGLALGNGGKYCEGLVQALRTQSLELVAQLPEVDTRFEQTQSLIKLGLDRLSRSSHIEHDGIAVYAVDGGGVIINRYSPFYFFPEARYSAGITRGERSAKITAMRNPWLEFPSVPLGSICERFGGGGHQRVGSIVLDGERIGEANYILHSLVSEIRREEETIEQKRTA